MTFAGQFWDPILKFIVLRTVICTGCLNLENCIFSLTYADTLLCKAFRLAAQSVVENK
jgi:hypothetical protein